MTTTADILGDAAADGDPDAVGRAAHALAQLADRAASAELRLRSMQTGRWRGSAADAFHSQRTHDLPEQLARLAASCERAERSLTMYAARLGTLQAHAKLLARQRDQALDDVARRTAACDLARTRAATKAQAATVTVDPPTQSRLLQEAATAKASAARAQAARDAAEEHLRRLEAKGAALRSEHRAFEQECRAALDEAADVASSIHLT